MNFESPTHTQTALAKVGYIASEEIAMASFLALSLGKPILAEGPAGTGKTELAKALARTLERPLFRVQCYEGLDEAKLLYEWKYAKQLLYTQMLGDKIGQITADSQNLRQAVNAIAREEDAFFSEHFLEPRPLLQSIRSAVPTVLLIDEVDRAEEEMEALFLEVLAEGQVTVAELGTLTATTTPLVVLTSNDTRELSDALRRRCLHLYLDYPSVEREAEILRQAVPNLGARLASQIAEVVANARTLNLKKAPSLSEAIDWAQALVLLSAPELGPTAVNSTLALLLKHRGDLEIATQELAGSLSQLSTDQQS